MQKFTSFFKEYKGISIGIVSLLLALCFVAYPSFAEAVYRKGLFQAVRVVMDFTITLLPFPLFILLLLLLPVIIFFYFKKNYSRKRHIIILPLNALGWVLALFLLLWGYNYTCPDALPAHYNQTPTTEDLYAFGLKVAKTANTAREQCTDVNTMIDNDVIRTAVEAFAQQHGFPTIGKVKCKEVDMGGVMRRLGVAGIYFPFTGESYCDATFPPLVKMFIKAHEMSHGYGVTDEGEADYFAYKALRYHTGEPVLSYVAELELLRSIRSKLYFSNDSLRQVLDSSLNHKVLEDLRVIRENALQYQEFFPGAQIAMNDNYLKLMGVEQGVKSYERFVEYIWHESKISAWNPQ